MSETAHYSAEDMQAFARRHGLCKLEPAHLARMAELASYVSELGRTLPRPTHKEDGPAPTFVVPNWRT